MAHTFQSAASLRQALCPCGDILSSHKPGDPEHSSVMCWNSLLLATSTLRHKFRKLARQIGNCLKVFFVCLFVLCVLGKCSEPLPQLEINIGKNIHTTATAIDKCCHDPLCSHQFSSILLNWVTLILWVTLYQGAQALLGKPSSLLSPQVTDQRLVPQGHRPSCQPGHFSALTVTARQWMHPCIGFLPSSLYVLRL